MAQPVRAGIARFPPPGDRSDLDMAYLASAKPFHDSFPIPREDE
jgi:hypothetical protein